MRCAVLNTVILLLSGVSVTWVQYALVAEHLRMYILHLLLQLVCRFYSYAFNLLSIWVHLMVLRILFMVYFLYANRFTRYACFCRNCILDRMFIPCISRHFNQRSYSGFLFAAWYWHFVDAVWLFLFVSIYLWSDL